MSVLPLKDFCAEFRIGRSTFYRLLAEGRAPETFLVGGRRKLTREAVRAWHKRMVEEDAARRAAA